LTEPNFRPETLAFVEPPLFRPIRLDHVLLNVTDVEKSSAFYQKVLGPPAGSSNGEVWFTLGVSRLGLTKVPAGERSGLNRIGILAAAFDRAAMAGRLRELGIGIEIAGGSATNSVALRYPDGLIHVIGQ
jgi:catechol 2,3-dioxygenase-like lactoylglutathione lyase family enzyme